ncbi:beta/alpha barrel domain-containing protein [Hydrogenovibrio kuenenii]|uniref:pyruvate carboxyltransferase n=1 Tax=Hydrogenovibrio kuenenii TaxID=63658 RepID=UPI000467223B|nr:pyruvate carboxyltransferase [Hydrogenovibrio kuenenii]
MKKDSVIFDCTIREAGYQTGWHFDKKFVIEWYQLLLASKIDYMELGFFHDQKHDPGRGIYRYCSQRNQEIKDVLERIKSRTKLSSMLDLQRPLSEILPQEDTIIDTIRIINRSHENDFNALAKKVEELSNKGYEVCINYTSSGYNTREMNRDFLQFSKDSGVSAVYFADTESVFTEDYVKELIEECDALDVTNYGLHFHDKRGLAKDLMTMSYEMGCRKFDSTLLGFGGKWHDWNLTSEFIFEFFEIKPDPVEFNNRRRDLVQQIIKYKQYDTTVIED